MLKKHPVLLEGHKNMLKLFSMVLLEKVHSVFFID